MGKPRNIVRLLVCAAMTAGVAACAATGSAKLEGTSWRLVKFQSGDDSELVPDDRDKYTLTFGTDGRASMRFDCNRGTGPYTHTPPSGLEFGNIAITRAMCLPPSLHDEIVKRWPYIRSYVIEGGHLHMAMMADGGIFEYEPAP